MDDYCTVTFTGTKGGTYYVACSLVEYLNEELVNTGSSTIYLYKDILQGSSEDTITIAAGSYPRYGSGYNYYYITNADNVSFNNRAYFYRERGLVDIVLISLLVSINFIRLMVRRH